jgi:hypothetical protein
LFCFCRCWPTNTPEGSIPTVWCIHSYHPLLSGV